MPDSIEVHVMHALSPQEIVPKLKVAADAQRGAKPLPELSEILNGVAQLRRDERTTVFQLVCDMLPEVSSATGAGIIAIWLGGSVEQGRDPQPFCRPVLVSFLKWSHRIDTANTDDDEDEREREEDSEVLAGLRLLGTALVAVLSRMPEQEMATLPLAELGTEAERVEPVSIGAAWVLQLLRQRSGELIVLVVERRKGCLVRYENLANCFHLFTLLQGALADMKPRSASLSQRAVAVARGDEAANAEDSAWWHYGQPYAAAANVAASVWGEGSPAEIAAIDGTQVILLWPAILGSRTWSSDFFHPVLHASLPKLELVRSLEASEVDAWWKRLGLPERRGWWKF